jgi:chitodextrinase
MNRGWVVAIGLALMVFQTSPALAADPVVAAAGDIACGAGSGSASCKQMATSDLLVNRHPAAVLPLGDVQYEDGALSDFRSFYAPSWGRVLSITHPAVGNHEYGTSGASGYWDYFDGVGASTGIGGDRGRGFYSYDVGAWHLVALNTNCGSIPGGCGAGSQMEAWFKADLAAHPTACTLVYAHHPRWTSDTRDFDKPELDQLWKDMQTAGVELYLVGHSHFYERMAPAMSDETIDRAHGVRQIIAGTGGRNVYGFGTIEPISEVRNGSTFGVLEITLHPTSYDWNFVPIAGSTFTDSGTDTCHGPMGSSGDTTAPTAPQNLTAPTVSSGQVDLSWSASTDDVGVSGYDVYRGTTKLTTVTGTTYSDTGVQPSTSYSYYVIARDAAGHSSPQSNTATVTTPAAPGDTTKPSQPAGLTASATSSSQVNLSWTGSTDNVGVTGYDVYRGAAKLTTVPGTTYSDPGLQPSTSYGYYVVARDAAGNLSPQSNTATATTQAAPTGNTLTFTPSDDGYAEQGTTTSFGSATDIVTDNSPVRHMFLRFAVSGVNGRRVLSAKLRLHNFDPSDKGGDFHQASANWTEAGLTWAQQPTLGTATVGSLGAVAAGNWYEVDVSSLVTGDGPVALGATSTSTNGAYYDSKEGAAGMAPQLVLTLGSADTSVPTAPAGLTGTATATKVDLSWTGSTDDVGVKGYEIYRGTTLLDTSPTTTYSDTTVQANTSYQYTVKAYDAAGNRSGASNTFSVTTPAPAKVLTFTPTDDSYAEQDTPATPYGSDIQIIADNSPVKHLFTRFVVSGVGGGKVVSAKLRLYCVDPSNVGGSFQGGDPLWSESSLSWTLQPTLQPPTVATLGAVTTGTWYEVDVTPLVKGDGAVTIAATSTSADGAHYASKERTGGFAPQLVVATG